MSERAPPGFRTMPHNVEVERLLLGGLMVNQDSAAAVGKFLQPEHFYTPQHARIYERVQRANGHLVDHTILKPGADQDEALREVGGGEYLTKLATGGATVMPHQAEQLAREIHDLAIKRALISIGEELVNRGYDLNLPDSGAQQITLARGHLDLLAREAEKGASAKPSFVLLRDLQPNLISNDIVKGLIPRNAFIEAHAVSGGGKTAIIVDLMLHIAAHRPYRGRRVERQPVVYVALEGHSGIDNRCIAARDELGITEAPFALVKTTDNFREPEAAQKVATIARQMLKDFGGDCPVIVIDTYTAALGAGGSDCDPKDVSAFIEHVKVNLLGIGCSVLINHHFGKDASRGGRGWSGLNAALDVELEIDRDEDLRTMRITKARDGSDSQPAFCYRFYGREIGTDNHGDVVTAVVVEHLADEDTAKRGKKHSPKARAAMNKLWEMIKTPSASFPMADQPGLRCVILSAWETACIAPGALSNATAEKERRYKFNQAKKELEDASAIVVDGGRVYPAPKHTGDAGE